MARRLYPTGSRFREAVGGLCVQTGSDDQDYPPISPISAGLAGRCPRCGDGRMFSGFINVAPRCENCGLDYSFAESGDGPAVFVALFGGFVVLGAALWTEVVYQPPMWVHMVVFLPLTLIVCLGLLRPFKGLLIALQYRNKAELGRLKG
ncbi:DUF983 domain-containing protein [Methylocapsa sp. S129]|uniref:DUF983 domain-containing protein n=1 Tax=Methylocapsa sp. S129 TaxID=1641869 RepID=UPI00131C7803